jgi:hypothetical protein
MTHVMDASRLASSSEVHSKQLGCQLGQRRNPAGATGDSYILATYPTQAVAPVTTFYTYPEPTRCWPGRGFLKRL